MSALTERHPEGRERASAFFSLRVALRDLVLPWRGLIRLYVGSTSRRALYTGVTVPLYVRVAAQEQAGRTFHFKNISASGWSTLSNSRIVEVAIVREKEIKGGRREKKNNLVESLNPGWKDLAADWYPEGLLKDGVPVAFSKIKT